MLYSGEGEIVESISSGGAGHLMEAWDAIPVRSHDLELFLQEQKNVDHERKKVQ